ncbi:MAG: methyltransferase [Alcanivoracaceae bacterium]|jgi:hypothetical protein|nr:methyltransferase [Alcanivoracaceae bacterium]
MTLTPLAPFSFNKIDAVLSHWQPLWQPAPFVDPSPAWISQYPQLGRALQSLDDYHYQQLVNDDHACLQWLIHYLPELEQLHEFSEEGPALHPQAAPLPLTAGCNARKKGQVSAFVASTEPRGQRLIEWCAGQGWLLEGLAVSFPQRQLVGLEWQQDLCQRGNQRLQQAGLSGQLQCVDVLLDAPPLTFTDSLLALHACGHLHQALIRQIVTQPVADLSMAPCCYHLGDRQPVSQAARNARLDSRIIDRHLAVQDVAAGHGNRQRHAQKNGQWRLGYELLRRHLSGDNQYRSAPSWSGHLLQGSFADFCRNSAHFHQIDVPDDINFDDWQRQGEQLHRLVRRLELPRRQFRRLLEWWLVLDLGSYLCEQGYEVQIAPFCSSTLTPRNLLIRAQRNGQ